MLGSMTEYTFNSSSLIVHAFIYYFFKGEQLFCNIVAFEYFFLFKILCFLEIIIFVNACPYINFLLYIELHRFNDDVN